MNTEELFDIVDHEDRVIQTGVTKENLHPNNDITRVVTAHLFNNQGQLVIAQRVATKEVDPLKFEAPAHGRVSSGESYEDAMRREAQEELGIEFSHLIEVAHDYSSFDTNIGKRQHFRKLFLGFTHQDIHYEVQEIESLKTFCSFDELLSYHTENPELFSNAVAADLQCLKDFFANESRQAEIADQLALLKK